MTNAPSFTDEETALLIDAQFFQKKATISEKIRAQLEKTGEALKAELSRGQLPALPHDHLSAQFVRGEHLENFPYQYLDCPKYFHGPEKRTFRTLVWWGHHVACAWLLETIELQTDMLRTTFDSAAHDLRGPLYRARVRIEESLQHEGLSEDARGTMEATLAELERVQRTLGTLLQIAQAEGRGRDRDRQARARIGFRHRWHPASVAEARRRLSRADDRRRARVRAQEACRDRHADRGLRSRPWRTPADQDPLREGAP